MFGWIRRMFDSVAGRVDNTVRSWVHDLVNGLYGFLHLVFHDVGMGWNWFVRQAHSLSSEFLKLVHAIWAKLYAIARIIIPAVIREYRRLIAAANKFIGEVWLDALKGIAAAEALAGRLVTDAKRWVIRNVWTPLRNDLVKAWDWIAHEGATAWFYISHPDKLAALIFDSLIAKLEADAWRVGSLLGKFFLSLIVRNLRQFVALLEDILDAVL